MEGILIMLPSLSRKALVDRCPIVFVGSSLWPRANAWGLDRGFTYWVDCLGWLILWKPENTLPRLLSIGPDGLLVMTQAGTYRGRSCWSW